MRAGAVSTSTRPRRVPQTKRPSDLFHRSEHSEISSYRAGETDRTHRGERTWEPTPELAPLLPRVSSESLTEIAVGPESSDHQAANAVGELEARGESKRIVEIVESFANEALGDPEHLSRALFIASRLESDENRLTIARAIFAHAPSARLQWVPVSLLWNGRPALRPAILQAAADIQVLGLFAMQPLSERWPSAREQFELVEDLGGPAKVLAKEPMWRRHLEGEGLIEASPASDR